jgi:hypothetical protein
MTKKPVTNGKTKQMVVRLPIPMARQIEILAHLNSVTVTAVIIKLLTVAFGRLPEGVVKRMNEEIERRETQRRESESTDAEMALIRWAKF